VPAEESVPSTNPTSVGDNTAHFPRKCYVKNNLFTDMDGNTGATYKESSDHQVCVCVCICSLCSLWHVNERLSSFINVCFTMIGRVVNHDEEVAERELRGEASLWGYEFITGPFELV
jgi:hypothetical protein